MNTAFPLTNRWMWMYKNTHVTLYCFKFVYWFWPFRIFKI